MTKRVKSFAITLASLLGTALVAAMMTPEWVGFTAYLQTTLINIGAPASVVAILGVLVSEAWKAYLNSRKIAAYARKNALSTRKVTADLNDPDALDLY